MELTMASPFGDTAVLQPTKPAKTNCFSSMLVSCKHKAGGPSVIFKGSADTQHI